MLRGATQVQSPEETLLALKCCGERPADVSIPAPPLSSLLLPAARFQPKVRLSVAVVRSYSCGITAVYSRIGILSGFGPKVKR